MSRARICSSSSVAVRGCRLWLEHRVWVPVPDADGQVDVVGGAAARQHGVQLLPGFFTGDDAMHGAGDTLCGVHGGCATELHRGLNVGAAG